MGLWSERAGGEVQRHGHTSTVLGGRMYTYGGRGSDKMTFHEGMEVLDPSTLVWKQLRVRSSPPPRAFHTADAIDASARLVVFGGSGPRTFYNDLWLFRADRSCWESCTTAGEPPSPRAAHSSVLHATARPQLVIFGGTDGETSFGDVWLLPIERARWERVPTTGPSPVASFMLAVKFRGLISAGVGPVQLAGVNDA